MKGQTIVLKTAIACFFFGMSMNVNAQTLLVPSGTVGNSGNANVGIGTGTGPVNGPQSKLHENYFE